MAVRTSPRFLCQPPLLTHLTHPFHGKDVSEAPNSRRGYPDSGQCLFLKSFMSGPVAQILQEPTLAAPQATGQRLPLARSVSRHRPTRQSASLWTSPLVGDDAPPCGGLHPEEPAGARFSPQFDHIKSLCCCLLPLDSDANTSASESHGR